MRKKELTLENLVEEIQIREKRFRELVEWADTLKDEKEREECYFKYRNKVRELERLLNMFDIKPLE